MVGGIFPFCKLMMYYYCTWRKPFKYFLFDDVQPRFVTPSFNTS